MKKIFTITLCLCLIFSSSLIGIITSSAFCLDNARNDQNNGKRYAVLLVGSFMGKLADIPMINQYYRWYLNDAGRMYKTLRDVYGFEEDNIYLLAKLLPDLEKYPVPNDFDPDWIDYESSSSNLVKVLNICRDQLDEDDLLFLYIINHGGATENGGVTWKKPDKCIQGLWNNGEFACDNNTETFAKFNKISQNNWSDYITLELNEPINIRGFRIRANNHRLIDPKDEENGLLTKSFDMIELEFYKNENFVEKVEMNWWPYIPSDWWEYYRFEDNKANINVDKVKIRFQEKVPNFSFPVYPIELYEFDFWPMNGGYDLTETHFQYPFLNISSFINWLGDKSVQLIRDTELKEYLEDIESKMVIVLHPCRAGGFIDDLSGDNRIVLSGGRGAEYSPAGWVGHLRLALEKKDGSDEDDFYDADFNMDGNVSILEAYRYAANYVYDWSNEPVNKYQRQHPLIDDDCDGVGHHFLEEGYVDNGGTDGFNASQTFLDFKGVPGDLTAEIENEDFSFKVGEEIDFLGSVSGGYPRYSYIWDFGDGNSSFDQDPEHTYEKSGEYEITFTVTDEKNNSNTVSATLSIEEKKGKAKNSCHNFLHFLSEEKLAKLIKLLNFFSFLNF